MKLNFQEHRYLNKIDEAITKGYPLCYLYGKGITDYSLFNLHLGINEIQESLFLYFYNVQKVDIFVIIKNNKVTFLDKNGKSITSTKALNIQKESSGFGANIGSLSNEENEKTNQEARDATENISGFENDLKYIEEHYNSKKIAIYFDEFEWQSSLYGGEANLELLKRVRNWNKSKKSFIIVSIKEPKLLKEYGFEVEEELPNMVYIGNPSQSEIAKAYRRHIYINRPDIDILEDDFDYIISAIQGSNKSLRESIRVLKRILSNCEKNIKLTKELFTDSFNKNLEEKVTFDDVVMDGKIKREILKIISTFHTDKENSSKGVVLYGPSGTGKTYIAKAIAHEYQMNFMSFTLADLKGEYIGQSSGKIKRVFEEARANAPTIIFLDEIDTIFNKRSSNDTDSYTKDMVNQFLVEIDGAKTAKQEIFIIGATNRLETIDPAIRSRLSNEFLIDLPDSTHREIMFDKRFKEFKLSQQSWKQSFIERTEGMSGRDIDNFIKGIKSLNIEDVQITQEIFYTALKSLERRFINDFELSMDNSLEIEENIRITFDNVIGYQKVKDTLTNELRYILLTEEEKEEMKRFKIIPKRGNLLYGPPGNGKTTFAKALAGESDFYYIKILSKNFTGYSSLEILNKIELIFLNTIKLSKMTQKKGIVLFFDEIDTLININMDTTVRGTLLNFLEDKSGIKAKDSKIILIGATNFKEHLDEASIREGRFDSKLEIGYPSKEEAIEMLKLFFSIDKTLDISSLTDEDYLQFYETLEKNKNLEIEKHNQKIKDSSFHKVFEGIPTVDLEGYKESIKTDSYFKESIKDGLIFIENILKDK